MSDVDRKLQAEYSRTLEKINNDDCMLYAGHISPDGYARLSEYESGKTYHFLAHRVMYEKHIGPIPKGLHIDHLCRTPACMNPDHLEAVTRGMNTQRIYGIGICKRGHELTDDNIYIFLGNKATGRMSRKCRKCTNLRAKIRRSRTEEVTNE